MINITIDGTKLPAEVRRVGARIHVGGSSVIMEVVAVRSDGQLTVKQLPRTNRAARRRINHNERRKR